MVVFIKPIEFVWDKGNDVKNFEKHGVSNKESEEAFFDELHKIFKDKIHSGREERFRIVGKTKKGRLLFIVFTMRNKKISVISSRDINRKEECLYEEKTNFTKVQK